MTTFDIYRIGDSLYLVVQAPHLLELNTVILVPLLPTETVPALSKLTVEVRIDGRAYSVRAHMPLTVEAQRLRRLSPVHRLTPEEGHRVMDGLYTILWGL